LAFVPLAGVEAVLDLLPSVSSAPCLAWSWAAPVLTNDEDSAATLPPPSHVAAAVHEMHLRLAAGFFFCALEKAPASLSQPQ
jgi:hypothetical protein